MLSQNNPGFYREFKYHLPVCLPWSDNDPGRGISNGDKTVITGWGRTQNPSIDNESDVVFSTKLQKVPVAISNDKCQPGDKFEVDPQIQLCAGGEKGQHILAIPVLYFPMKLQGRRKV